MTLTTHAVIGAASASIVYLLVQEPVAASLLGFAAAFGSHFALDSIPHWSEGKMLRAVSRDSTNRLNTDMKLSGKDFLHDISFLAFDAILGLLLSIGILTKLFHIPLYISILGSVGGQTPDALQFVYWKTKFAFMTPLQVFHGRIQEEHDDVWYLGIEAGLILSVVALGILGLFMV